MDYRLSTGFNGTTHDIKSKQMALQKDELYIQDLSVYPCPIPQYAPVPKLNVPTKDKLNFYSKNSHNMKRSISKDEKKEMENIIYQYELLTKQNGSPVRSLERQASPLQKSKLTINFAKSMLQKSQRGMQGQSLGINTLAVEKQQQIQTLLQSEKPKVRPQTAKPKKKKKKRDEEEESVGEKILPHRTQLVAINKSEFKYFKPWLQESNLPKWAEDLQDKPITEILAGTDKETKKILKQMKETKTIEIGPEQYNPQRWVYNEQKGQKNRSYKDDLAQNEERQKDKRVVQIFTKIANAFVDYHDKMQDQINLDEPFDPKKVRAKLDQQQKEKLDEVNFQLLNKATEHEQKLLNMERNIYFVEEDMRKEEQKEVNEKEEQEVNEIKEDSIEEDIFEEEKVMEGDEAFNFENEEEIVLQSFDELTTQADDQNDDGIMIEEDVVEKFSKAIRMELFKKQVIIDRKFQEQQVKNQIREEEDRKLQQIENEKQKIEDQEIKQYYDTRSEFAKQFEAIVGKEFEKSKFRIGLDLIYEEEKNKKAQEEAQREAELKDKKSQQQEKKNQNRKLAEEQYEKRQKQMEKTLGQKLPNPATIKQPLKGSINSKLDQWISNFDKQLKNQEIIDKLLTKDHLENYQEYQKTLKEFEEVMNYFENNGKYQKQMEYLVKKYEQFETQTQQDIIESYTQTIQ